MIKLEEYYPLLVFQTGSHKAVTKKLKNIKNDFTSLWNMLKGLFSTGSTGSVLLSPPRRSETDLLNKWQCK